MPTNFVVRPNQAIIDKGQKAQIDITLQNMAIKEEGKDWLTAKFQVLVVPTSLSSSEVSDHVSEWCQNFNIAKVWEEKKSEQKTYKLSVKGIEGEDSNMSKSTPPPPAYERAPE